MAIKDSMSKIEELAMKEGKKALKKVKAYADEKVIPEAKNYIEEKLIPETEKFIEEKAKIVLEKGYEEAKTFTKEKAIPAASKAYEDTKTFAKEKAVPAIKKASEDIKEFTVETATPAVKNAAIKTKEVVVETYDKVAEKAKEIDVHNIVSEEELQKALKALYIQSVNGIQKVSVPVDDLVKDYLEKNKDVDSAIKSLVNNSLIKCGTSGFITSFGGFLSAVVTLPANISSVMYIQLRMCCAIAKIGGYDVFSDQVQTMIYACLTGSAMTDVFKQAGVKFTTKLSTALIEKIPGAVLTKINQAVGFRFITKFGEKGIVNLGQFIPGVGGLIAGSIDVLSTKAIAKNAYKLFIKGELDSNDEIIDKLPIDVDVKEVNHDLDYQVYENNVDSLTEYKEGV